MIGGQLHDAVSESDVLSTLTGGRKKNFGRRRVRVFFEKMMLDFRCVVETQPVGELDLGNRLF
jgi:hypothetical protein